MNVFTGTLLRPRRRVVPLFTSQNLSALIAFSRLSWRRTCCLPRMPRCLSVLSLPLVSFTLPGLLFFGSSFFPCLRFPGKRWLAHCHVQPEQSRAPSRRVRCTVVFLGSCGLCTCCFRAREACHWSRSRPRAREEDGQQTEIALTAPDWTPPVKSASVCRPAVSGL